MKEALLQNAESVIELLESNEIQSIEVRSALNAAIALKNSINSVDELQLEIVKQVKQVKK